LPSRARFDLYFCFPRPDSALAGAFLLYISARGASFFFFAVGAFSFAEGFFFLQILCRFVF